MAENNTQNQRTFLIVTGLALGVFVLMLFFFSSSSANTENPEKPVPNNELVQTVDGYQEVYIKALRTGLYDKQTITVKKGIPVRLHFSADPLSGCGKMLIMKKFAVQLLSSSGEEKVATFTPNEAGTFEYSCSMRMFRGSMRVVA